MTKVLVVVYYDYHLYGYIYPLVKELIDQGCNVTLLTCDLNFVQKFNNFPQLKIKKNRGLRFFINRMGNRFVRPFGWVYGWVWSFFYTWKYDIIVAPTDNKPFYHMVTAWKKSFICQGGLGGHDKKYLQYLYRKDIPLPDPNHYLSGGHGFVDRVFGGTYTGNIRGSLLLKHYGVLGGDIAKFYQELGVPQSHVHIVGNLNYNGLSLDEKILHEISQRINLDATSHLYIYFSSQLAFYDKDLSILADYLRALFANDKRAFFCFKVHPRIDTQELKKLNAWCLHEGFKKVIILKDYAGDLNNYHLIALSYAVIIEDSNVGFLAIYQQKPLLIIDLRSDKYTSESFFLYYDGIMDCTSVDKFEEKLKNLSDPEYILAQNKVIEKVCLINRCSPAALVELLTTLVKA